MPVKSVSLANFFQLPVYFYHRQPFNDVLIAGETFKLLCRLRYIHTLQDEEREKEEEEGRIGKGELGRKHSSKMRKRSIKGTKKYKEE